MNWYKTSQGWPVGLHPIEKAKSAIKTISSEQIDVAIDVLKKYVKQFNKIASRDDLAYLLKNHPVTQWQDTTNDRSADSYYYEKFAKLVLKRYHQEMNRMPGTSNTGPR